MTSHLATIIQINISEQQIQYLTNISIKINARRSYSPRQHCRVKNMPYILMFVVENTEKNFDDIMCFYHY